MAGLDGSRVVCGDWEVDRMAQVHLSLCIWAAHYITHLASSLIVSSAFNINFMLPIVLDAACHPLALYLDLACLYHHSCCSCRVHGLFHHVLCCQQPFGGPKYPQHCYGQLLEWLCFSPIYTPLSLLSLRSRLIYGGPIYLLVRSPFLFSLARSWGRTYPYSCPSLPILSGVRLFIWLPSWSLRTASL